MCRKKTILAIKLTELVNDIKLYLKKLYELNEQFPEEFIKGKDKIDEIEQDAQKIIEAISQIRNAWNVEDYEKNMAIICGIS
ncbi:hypothetical protein LOAG_11232 [Loa loa]|uniref:Uncharacterized protein n=1 Tax=Loa loa TaxID=7209 RepID=A0A1S0TNW3_LOALO|nr:hypothetical protein LOAG_11232 [Loa loa]EFO17269.2 hypothetical protein LOAG_11232 [Loa loa]